MNLLDASCWAVCPQPFEFPGIKALRLLPVTDAIHVFAGTSLWNDTRPTL